MPRRPVSFRRSVRRCSHCWAPSPGELILDLGCGDGELTEKIVAAGAAVVAVDAAPDMVAAARARRIDARVMDGHSLNFDSKFDAVFSNAALHWMRDQEAVLAGVHRALKSRRRFVAEMGGHNNTAAIVVALSAVLARRGLDAHQFSPWYFPSADAYRARLEAAGFTVEEIAIVPRPTPLPTDIEQWLDTFAEDFFGVITEPDRSRREGGSRRFVAARPDGRDRNLDRRLRPAALSCGPRRVVAISKMCAATATSAATAVAAPSTPAPLSRAWIPASSAAASYSCYARSRSSAPAGYPRS